MYKVVAIKDYEFTRDITVESQKSKQKYTAFDDSDLIGTDQFSFARKQGVYDCKLGILGKVSSAGEPFTVLSRERVGKMNLLKVSNSAGDNFYFPAPADVKVGSQIKLNVERYDLLAVNDVINDRTL